MSSNPRKRSITISMNSNNKNENNNNQKKKKSKINALQLFQNELFSNVLENEYDKKFAIKIMNAISKSQIVMQLPQNIPQEILLLIALLGIGELIPCCRLNDILVLPSAESIAEMYACDHCSKLSCAFRCPNCIDEENRIKRYRDEDLPEMIRKYDEAIGSEFCTECMWVGTIEQNLCMNCVFICLNCRQYRCTRYHLQIICPKCGGGFCETEEADFIKCKVCDVQCCCDCQWVWCNWYKNEINCGQIFDICRDCYSSNIVQQYYYKCDKMISCIKKSKHMQTYLDLPLNLIELICMMCD